jgi:hypothetical protein
MRGTHRQRLITLVLTCGLTLGMSEASAQNAAMPCQSKSGAEKEKCLRNGPPADAKHAAAAGGQSSSNQARNLPDQGAPSNDRYRKSKKRR